MKSVTAYFKGSPGDTLDIICHNIFREHGGKPVGSGTDLSTGERDVQYDVPEGNVGALCRALGIAGFRYE